MIRGGPTRGVTRLLVRGLLLALAVGIATGCRRKKGEQVASPSGPFTVFVSATNQGFFDVNVYLMRSPGSVGRRLGTVSGNNTVMFRFQDTELQAGGQLQLNARAIGSRTSWTTPILSVGPGMVARLLLFSSPSGDLARSQFYIDTNGGGDAAGEDAAAIAALGTYRFQAFTTASPMRAMTVFPSLSPQ